MNLQYISDQAGKTTAIIIPVEEWDLLRSRYPEVDDLEGELPQWQKDLIDQRLESLESRPERVISGADFSAELEIQHSS